MPEKIECDGCGRSFTTDDAADMLAAIKGPCPTCGGRFRVESADGSKADVAPAPPPRTVP